MPILSYSMVTPLAREARRELSARAQRLWRARALLSFRQAMPLFSISRPCFRWREQERDAATRQQHYGSATRDDAADCESLTMPRFERRLPFDMVSTY